MQIIPPFSQFVANLPLHSGQSRAARRACALQVDAEAVVENELADEGNAEEADVVAMQALAVALFAASFSIFPSDGNRASSATFTNICALRVNTETVVPNWLVDGGCSEEPEVEAYAAFGIAGPVPMSISCCVLSAGREASAWTVL